MSRPSPLAVAALVGVLSLAGAGCKPQPVAGATVTPGRPGGATTATNAASNASPKAGAPEAAAPEISEIDPSLKNDAFSYYGLGRPKPITMNITAQGSTSAGSQDVRLLKAAKDEAQFEIISTDALAMMGRSVLALRPDGLHVVESDLSTTDPKEFELPADLRPGSSWTVHQSTDRGAQVMKLALKQTVVGPEALKTKVGQYPDALRVDGIGTGTLNGKPVTIKTQSWFVRDRGNVKYSISRTVGKMTDTMVVEEIP